MARFLVRRVLVVVPMLLLVSIVVFLLVAAVPGDAAQTLAGEGASQELIERTREELGLADPLVEQYVRWLTDVLQGDLGTSLTSGQPVADMIWRRLPVSLSLGLLSIVLASVAAVAAGLIAALRPDGKADRLVTAFTGLALAAPPFVVGILLVSLFAVQRNWMPALGYVPFAEDPWEWFRHLVLPAIAVGLVPAAELARHARGAMVDAMSQDYVRTARSRGIRPLRVIGKHAGKNAAIPVVTVAGVVLGRVLNGVVTVEFVFALPGFGSLAYNSVLTRDLPTIQGVVLVSALIVIVVNLLVDASYLYFNPRSRR